MKVRRAASAAVDLLLEERPCGPGWAGGGQLDLGEPAGLDGLGQLDLLLRGEQRDTTRAR